MSKNTIKYEYTEGCPNDKIGVLSSQSYVKEERGRVHSEKSDRIQVEHGNIDFVLRAGRYDKIRDKSGKVVERRKVETREDEGLSH